MKRYLEVGRQRRRKKPAASAVLIIASSERLDKCCVVSLLINWFAMELDKKKTALRAEHKFAHKIQKSLHTDQIFAPQSQRGERSVVGLLIMVNKAWIWREKGQ